MVDAIGGTSVEAYRAGLDRMVQGGARPVSWVSLAVELQRDWARLETVQQRGDGAYRTTAQGGIKLTKGIIGIGNFGGTGAASSPLAAQRRAT